MRLILVAGLPVGGAWADAHLLRAAGASAADDTPGLPEKVSTNMDSGPYDNVA